MLLSLKKLTTTAWLWNTKPQTWASVCSVTVAGSQRCQPTNSSRSRERVDKARVAGAKPASRESSRQVCSWHIRRVTCCEMVKFISSRTFGQRANSSAWNYNSNTQETLTVTQSHAIAAFRLASFWRKFLATENLPVWTGFLAPFFWYKKVSVVKLSRWLDDRLEIGFFVPKHITTFSNRKLA